MEISHRRADAQEVLDTTIALTKELLNIPDTHEVIFLQGGAFAIFYGTFQFDEKQQWKSSLFRNWSLGKESN